MNKTALAAAFLLLAAPAALAADAKKSPPADHMNGMMMQQSAPAEIKLTQKGKVVSTIDVPQYTYLEVSQDGKTRWLAGSTLAVKKGDTVQFDDGMEMQNFKSTTLNRTFPSITFVNRVEVSKN